MEQPDREATPRFSTPHRQIVLMLIVLALTGAGAFLAAPRVLPVFEANPWLNGFIFLVFVIGVIATFWQVFQLIGSVRWIKGFAAQDPGHDPTGPPSLLAPLATMLRGRGARIKIASSSARSILDSVAQRIDEAREITRYLVSLLIFLGLLGTFYGLATTIPAVVDTIRSLAPREGEEGVAIFNRLMTGLEAQLGGMGVAFASSLLGLSGSLVVGLLELFAAHGQNRFYRELEEWISTMTRLGLAEGEEGGRAMMTEAIDQMTQQVEALQSTVAQSEMSRAVVDEKLGILADSIERLTHRMSEQNPVQVALMRVADGQERLIEAVEARETSEGLDAESRMRLRSIDVQMLRILEEISAGRQETMTELRTDLAALTRLMGQARGAAPRPAPRAEPGEGG